MTQILIEWRDWWWCAWFWFYASSIIVIIHCHPLWSRIFDNVIFLQHYQLARLTPVILTLNRFCRNTENIVVRKNIIQVTVRRNQSSWRVLHNNRQHFCNSNIFYSSRQEKYLSNIKVISFLHNVFWFIRSFKSWFFLKILLVSTFR